MRRRKAAGASSRKAGHLSCETCLAPFTFARRAYRDFHLLMPLFGCRSWEGVVEPQEGPHCLAARRTRRRLSHAASQANALNFLAA